MHASPFTLHPQLLKDCFTLGDLELCRVLLMNNRLFPWVILVPRRPSLCEITDLTQKDSLKLMEEMVFVSRAMQTITHAQKMNIAALGNVVPQLHVHIIARFEKDAAWPRPVWGHGSEPYALEEGQTLAGKLQQALALTLTT